MHRNIRWWLVGLIILVIGLIFAFSRTPEQQAIDRTLIGDGITVRRATVEGVKTENAHVSIPFSHDDNTYAFTNVAIDLNKDGRFAAYQIGEKTQEEWVVRNMPARVLVAEANGFGFRLPDMTIEDRRDFPLTAMLTPLAAETWEGSEAPGSAIRRLMVSSVEPDDARPRFKPKPGFIGGSPQEDAVPNLDPSGAREVPAEIGASAAEFDEFHPNVPDITQGENECVPTSTANSMLWLARQNGFEDRLPPDLVSDLKRFFRWTSDGVVEEHFVSGMQSFIDVRNLPIEFHKVGGDYDIGIVQKIAEELRSGQDVEIIMEYFTRDAAGNYILRGGHMVTVVGAHTEGDDQYLDFRDPLSPGPVLHVYRINRTRVIDYLYQGNAQTFIRSAYAESPIRPSEPPVTTTPPSDALPPRPSPPGVVTLLPPLLIVFPVTLQFTHEIGKTECPTKIGKVTIDDGRDLGWKVDGKVPAWLKLSSQSGKAPGSLALEFTCTLSKYVTQTLSTELHIQAIDAKGLNVGDPKTVTIKGQINE